MASHHDPLNVVTNEHEVRKQKLEVLRKQGIAPWPSAHKVTATCRQVHDEYKPEQESQQYAVAGRIMTIRSHGKTAFFTIQDASGRLQIYLKKDVLGDQTFELIEQTIDNGDIVWAIGTPFVTKTQEITLKVEKIVLLSKSLHPLPEKFHGIADVEMRYRQRYLDLIMSQETKEKFIKRTMIVRSIRRYLDDNGFLEVETPMLHPIAGGANARPFTTHHNAFASDFYLRIAPELYLKRLAVGGFERVYEINRNFRNEGVSTRHNPEFTMLELYLAHHDYEYMMDFSEQMIKHVIDAACGTRQVAFGERVIDFEKPFARMTIIDALIAHAGVTNADLSSEHIDATLKKHGVQVASNASVVEKAYALFEETVESKLIQPTFIIDHPIEVSPLARRSDKNPAVAARFELYIAGMEIANSFNELNDPIDQAERFKAQLEKHRAGDAEAHQYDADFITALEYGLAPTVGYGMGIDRLVMIATNTTSIKDVILFPTLKRKHE